MNSSEAVPQSIPQRSGLIWVQNPSSYVAMSRKVPSQAVTSRRRGGNRGVRHLVTNFSNRKAGESVAECERYMEKEGVKPHSTVYVAGGGTVGGAEKLPQDCLRNAFSNRRSRSLNGIFVRIMLAIHLC